MSTTPRETSPPRQTRFRFKSSSKRERATSPCGSACSTDPYSDRHKRSRHHRSSHDHRHSHHHDHHRSSRSRRRRSSPSPPAATPPLSPNTAFRESLFDALADDEGAAYWEGVYGQPIHTYSRYRPRRAGSDPASRSRSASLLGDKADSTQDNELERMSDEEYAAYVRAKMWEKSHAYIAEERAFREKAREEERERRKVEAERRRTWKEEKVQEDRGIWETMVDEGLARGKGRAEKRLWEDRWKRYLQAWEDLKGAAEDSMKRSKDGTGIGIGARKRSTIGIPWPVASARAKDVNFGAVREFFQRVASASASAEVEHAASLAAMLKHERIRWHPDKISQRFGTLGIDEATLKTVTAVFQIVDQLWTETKGKTGQGA